jgi:hypothetical protein
MKFKEIEYTQKIQLGSICFITQYTAKRRKLIKYTVYHKAAKTKFRG